MSNQPHLFVAAKAFICNPQGQVLVLRESAKYVDGTNVGYYDVPGGRIKPGENHLDCLRREVREETGLEVEVGTPFATTEWCPTIHGEPWQIVGIFFRCTPKSMDVQLSTDHDDFKWINPAHAAQEGAIPNMVPTFERFLNKE